MKPVDHLAERLHILRMNYFSRKNVARLAARQLAAFEISVTSDLGKLRESQSLETSHFFFNFFFLIGPHEGSTARKKHRVHVDPA